MPPGDYNDQHTLRKLDQFFDSTINGGMSKFLTAQEFDLQNAAGEGNTYGKLKSARTVAFAEQVCDIDDKLDHIRSAREVSDGSTLNDGDMGPGGKLANVFPFSWTLYAFNEQYLHIEDVMLVSILACCMTIFVVMMPFVVHPLTSIIVTVVIGTIVVELYGLLYLLDFKMNAVTLINVLVSVGIAVELTAHVGREFMVVTGTRVERAAKAVIKMAPPLTNGVFSTFFGVLTIAFSDYEYFRKYFFLQYVLILLVGLWNGLVFLPSLLSVIGPAAFVPEPEKEPALADI